jgi:hypothetical protein
MTLDRENLPALHRRLTYLEGQYRVNLDALGSDRYRTDAAIRHDVDELSNEIDELAYVLRRLSNNADSRIGVSWQTFITAVVVNGSFLILILYLLFRA